MTIVNQILTACTPLIRFVALLFGVIAAFKGLTELVPVIGQALPISVKGGSAQNMAIIAGALSLVGRQ
jgi:hypothetical protein